MCNPGKEANPFYQNPRRILKKYNTLFAKPLKKPAIPKAPITARENQSITSI